jgi:putative hydrolase of the HAD superfamily
LKRCTNEKIAGDVFAGDRVPIEVILIDADGVIQYAPEDWSCAFARCLSSEDPAQARKFTADIYAAETACLSQVGGFDEALNDVLRTWDRMAQKPLVLEAMMSIRKHHEVLQLISAIRAGGTRCYVASNQQTQRAEFMSAELGYASMFDGEFYSCNLGAAKPSERYFELALKAAGADAGSTLFIDDRPENVAGARRAGLHSFVYDGRSGVAVLESRLRDFGITSA